MDAPKLPGPGVIYTVLAFALVGGAAIVGERLAERIEQDP
jgi:hypothetical protein